MRFRILTSLGLMFALLFSPALVLAQEDVCDVQPGVTDDSAFCQGQDDPDAQVGVNGATDNAVIDILNTVVTILTSITAVIAVIVIIIAGLMFTVSNGDPGRISRARNAIIYAVVAVVVSISARIIVLYILNAIA